MIFDFDNVYLPVPRLSLHENPWMSRERGDIPGIPAREYAVTHRLALVIHPQNVDRMPRRINEPHGCSVTTINGAEEWQWLVCPHLRWKI